MDFLIYITISLLLVALIVFSFWNGLFSKKNKTEKDEFFEIKYQLQFYVAVFSTFIGMLAFFGYGSYKDLKDNISNDLKYSYEKKIDSANKVLEKLSEINAVELLKNKSQIEMLDDKNSNLLKSNEYLLNNFQNLSTKSVDLYNTIRNNDASLVTQTEKMKMLDYNYKNLKTDVEAINKIDFLKQVYLVPNLKYKVVEDINTEWNRDTIFFKNLKTIKGNKLPKFKNRPTVLISSKDGADFSVYRMEKDYFLITINSYTGTKENENKKMIEFYYDILIVYNESEE